MTKGMTNRKRLCLNMIVRNETANLARCLGALFNHIDCWVIGDTGSTDGTQAFVKAFFAAHDKPGELHGFPFKNFEQARNAALDCAYDSSLDYDYLLLADADMELVVEDESFRDRLEGPGYRLLQRTSSGFAYWNTRIVQRRAGARYHGVTHEYIDVPGGVQELREVWYKDHASGSNRTDKFERDIKLLSEALEQDPENSRHWYYLAQSYRDAGRTAEAAKAYAKRAEMGGWDEEAWHARLQEARCLRKLGDEGGFVRQALMAFNMRPQRAEPFYDLARSYREKGMNDASLLFSEAGLAIGRPEQDILFLEDYVYTAGMQEEFSIAANYARDPARKDRGFAACNWLALNRTIPDGTRELAWSNLHFYVEQAVAMLPSFAARPIAFTPPDGYRVLNPSVARFGRQIVLVQRTVNYEMSEDGLRYETPNNTGIHTRNFLLQVTDELGVESAAEILPPADLPDPVCKLVLGFEDLRLFVRGDQLWGSACFRELTPEAWCEQVLARIERPDPATYRLTDWRVLRPEGPQVHEKNWMPQVDADRLQFIYLCDPTRVVDDRGRTVSETNPAIAAGRFRGGSQLIRFDGGWLALVHEVLWRPSENRRFYQHRFVWFDQGNTMRKVSRPFFFNKKGVEFAAGLAWHPDERRLLISYSVADREAWIATVDAVEVKSALADTAHLPSGITPTVTRSDGPREPANGTLATRGVSPGAMENKTEEMEGPSLAAIFRHWGTDKVTNGYADLYDCLFRKNRHQVESLLEIGIGTMLPGVHSSMVGYAPEGYKPGGSLRAWGEFFPHAIIHGIDVQPDTQFHDDGRILTFLCDSTDATQVDHWRQSVKAKSFDIIIDDGSHQLNDQIATLQNFFPLLKTNGTYIVEDVIPGGIFNHVDKIKAICGDSPFFFAGPHNNPLVITKAKPIAKSGDERNSAARSTEHVVTTPAMHGASNDPGATNAGASPAPAPCVAASSDEVFLSVAPFLRAVDSPPERRKLSREFDARIAAFMHRADDAALPQIHCFYEVQSDAADHTILIAATASMRAAGHPVRMWSYSPHKLEFLREHGVELCSADDVVPRGLFERVVAGSEIRYFSDIFRYAVLYEHGGLWMDCDVVLLRPFPFHGDHFLNLQWRGGHAGHFICGNVMYAKPFSRHLRALYETSIERFFGASGWEFGVVGPKLLSDYLASQAGAPLRERLFSPMFFNAIDWTETDRFDKPLAELADYLNDERVFGIHLWAARGAVHADEGAPLGTLLADPLASFPSLTNLADRFNTDKNRHTGNRHCYARIYDRLLSSRRFSLRRLMEIGLCRGLAERNQPETPSVAMWQSYFPFCQVIGVDVTDFSSFNSERFRSFVCDQSRLDDLRAVVAQLAAGSLDVIIDDGSHASPDQQLTLREFWPLLADGGWYIIEDLDWQPPGEDAAHITPTKRLLREMQQCGKAQSADPLAVSELAGQMAEILFFDSHYELARANLLGGLVAIRKHGAPGLVL
ncbi:MAG: tetratricopeptide repeat protein [Alphaproteobacteria bacterium]|nr:tetratricopeptide repeat protein [Alphaproteobacteria bacterium]